MLIKQVSFIKNEIIASVTDYKSISIDARRYMQMHWFGGVFLIYLSILPVFMNKLGISLAFAGGIFTIASLFDAFFTIVSGKFIDKISPNIGISIDWITEAIPPLIYALALLPIHFVFGIIATKLSSILNPCYRVLESEIYEENEREKIYTYHLMTPYFFSIVMYLLTIIFMVSTDYSFQSFRIIFFICSIGFIIVSRIPLKKLKRVEPTKLEKTKYSFKVPTKLIPVFSAEMLLLIGMSILSPLITSYYLIDQLNGTVVSVLILEIVYSVTVIITGMFSKNLSKIMPQNKVLVFGVSLFVIYAGILFFSKSIFGLIIAMIFKSIGNTVWFPSHFSLLSKIIPNENKGQFWASMSGIKKITGVFLPILSATIATIWGFKILFSIAIVLFCLSGVLYYNLKSKEEKTTKESTKNMSVS